MRIILFIFVLFTYSQCNFFQKYNSLTIIGGYSVLTDNYKSHGPYVSIHNTIFVMGIYYSQYNLDELKYLNNIKIPPKIHNMELWCTNDLDKQISIIHNFGINLNYTRLPLYISFGFSLYRKYNLQKHLYHDNPFINQKIIITTHHKKNEIFPEIGFGTNIYIKYLAINLDTKYSFAKSLIIKLGLGFIIKYKRK